jgi:hypothetical protein
MNYGFCMKFTRITNNPHYITQLTIRNGQPS